MTATYEPDPHQPGAQRHEEQRTAGADGGRPRHEYRRSLRARRGERLAQGRVRELTSENAAHVAEEARLGNVNEELRTTNSGLLAAQVRLAGLVQQLEAANASLTEQVKHQQRDNDRLTSMVAEQSDALQLRAHELEAMTRQLAAEQEARASIVTRCEELERECVRLRDLTEKPGVPDVEAT